MKDYKKYRLIADWIIYWIPGKKEFLETLVNIKHFDKKEENLDKDFKSIIKKINWKITKKRRNNKNFIQLHFRKFKIWWRAERREL